MLILFFSYIIILIKIIFVTLLYKDNFKYKKPLSIAYLYFSFLSFYLILPYSKDTSTLQNIKDFLTITAVIFVISLFGMLYPFASTIKNKIKNKFYRILSFATSLTLVELLISFGIGLVMVKNHYPIHDYSVFNIGYSLSFTPIGALAYFGHVYILTFIIAIIIGVMFDFFKKNRYILLTLFLLITTFSVNNIEDSILSQNIYVGKENEKYEKIKNTISTDTMQKLSYVIDNGKNENNNEFYTYSTVYNLNSSTTTKIYKYTLMPFGEYYPSFFNILRIFNNDGIETYNRKDIVPINSNNNLIIMNGVNYLLLICSDAWSLRSVSRYHNKEIDYIILQRNDNVFWQSNFYKANILIYKKNLMNFYNVDKIIDKN